jgi:hypothetical protein
VSIKVQFLIDSSKVISQEQNVSDNISDTSKPSAGRMYDYLLGGSHNFEVDRQAADYMINYLPFITKFARLQRWALYDIANEMTRTKGFDVIIDFASGLPTSDHIHHNVPAGTTVIYSDFDPVVVEFASDMLKDIPNVYYFENDATRPEELLARPELLEILGDRRKVAIGYWGVSSFLLDDEISHAMRVLYDWAAPGSCLAYNAQGVLNKDDSGVQTVLELYANLGAPFYTRSLEQHLALFHSWQLDENGLIPLLEWHGFDETELGKNDKESFGPFGGGYGAYLFK